MSLEKSHVKALKKQAHHLAPVAMVGRHGVTPALIGKIEESLNSHELIKVKFVDCKDEKKELVRKITDQTQSELVTMIGHVAILFRRHEDDEKPQIGCERI